MYQIPHFLLRAIFGARQPRSIVVLEVSMKRFVLGACLAFCVSGCASQILSSYVGGSIEEPILDYGPPVNVLELSDGRRAYQWRIAQSGVVPMSSPSTATVYGSGGYATAYGTTTTYVPYSQDCTYTLTATRQGNQWIVDGYRQPSLMCE